MKILFFILGSIKDRITSVGNSSFTSLFQQDIIFYGPIPENKFVYNSKEIPIISINQEISITELFNLLPQNWYPDIITCETSVINLIPDIYKCPVKTYLLARDAWIDTIFNKGIVELFDFIRYQGIDRESYRALNPNLMPLSGVSTFIEEPEKEQHNKKYKDRPISVIAIANYSNSLYHYRYKLFVELARNIPKELKLKFFTNLKRNEIHDYYRKAKIVIDWSFTLSNRSNEAALNGCLLFSHEDNKTIGQIWEPWEEYIPFNNSNVIELIKYYVNNYEESEKIIENALRKLRKLPISFGDSILKQLHQALDSDHLPSTRIKHLESLSQTTLFHRISTPLYFNFRYPKYSLPKTWEEIYFKRINKSIAASNNEDVEVLLPPLIEASRMAFVLKRYEMAKTYLTQLESIFPNYAWTYYLYGRIQIESFKYNPAMENFEKAIRYSENNPDLLKKYIMPLAERANICDQRRVSDYLWHSSYNQNNEYQIKALQNLCYTALGDLQIINSNLYKAIEYYSLANTKLAIPNSFHKICDSFLKTKQIDQLLEASKEGLNDSPYDYKLFIYNTIAHLKLKNRKVVRLKIKEEIRVLKCFEGDILARKLRLILNLLVILLVFEKQITIIALLMILKRI